MAENLVMNYSNIEIHKLLFQQMLNNQNNSQAQNQYGAPGGARREAAEVRNPQVNPEGDNQ